MKYNKDFLVWYKDLPKDIKYSKIDIRDILFDCWINGYQECERNYEARMCSQCKYYDPSEYQLCYCAESLVDDTEKDFNCKFWKSREA